VPSKSKAQFRAMGYLYSKGKISRKVLREFNKGVDYKKLPARKKKKKS